MFLSVIFTRLALLALTVFALTGGNGVSNEMDCSIVNIDAYQDAIENEGNEDLFEVDELKHIQLNEAFIFTSFRTTSKSYVLSELQNIQVWYCRFLI